MIRGLYAAAAGMLVQDIRNDAIAQNLANVSTAGYRRQISTVRSFPSTFAGALDAAGGSWLPAPTILYPTAADDRSQGQIRQTGNPTDLALRGVGHFTIATPTGLAYTRDGAFTLNAARQLVTADGCPVLGQNGPVTINGTRWEIDRSGRVIVDGRVNDRLHLVRPADGATERRVGANRSTFPATIAATDVIVEQGHLEGSNVNAVAEMVGMIAATRQFEANQKSLQALDTTLDRAVNDIARV